MMATIADNQVYHVVKFPETATVELTKRAKTGVFFTLQAHIYKTIGDTRNINTFS